MREGLDFAWQSGNAMAKSSNVAKIDFNGDAIIYASENKLLKNKLAQPLIYNFYLSIC
jgi:hypothetical protein